MRLHRTLLASITILTLAVLTTGGSAQTLNGTELVDLSPHEHFDGAGLWQSSSGTPTFPGIGTATGSVTLTTDGADGTVAWGHTAGALQAAEGTVAWTKSPVVPYDDTLWDVRLEMDLGPDATFPGAFGGRLVAEGVWQATPLYGLCTLSYPNSCTWYAVGPLHLTNDGFMQSPGKGVSVAGLYGSTFCTSGAQTLNIHTPCDGSDLPCTNNNCKVVVPPMPDCLPDEQGDRVCVERDGGGVCVKGYQLTAPTDVLLYEQACFERTPMGFCVDMAAGLGTLSGFHGASGWACANAQWPVTCWTVHMGYAGDVKTC